MRLRRRFEINSPTEYAQLIEGLEHLQSPHIRRNREGRFDALITEPHFVRPDVDDMVNDHPTLCRTHTLDRADTASLADAPFRFE